MGYIASVLTIASYWLNHSAHSGSKSSFGQLVEQVAPKRTTELEWSTLYTTITRLDKTQSVDLPLRVKSMLPDGSETDDSWYWTFQFSSSIERTERIVTERPTVDAATILHGNVIPTGSLGFACKHAVTGMALAESGFDRLFTAGRLFWNRKKDSLQEHVSRLHIRESNCW